MYKIRIILDTKEDVIRTISIDENCTLEQFHFAIANVFGFNGKEMASFYLTDNDWNQGDEIPLISMENHFNDKDMTNTSGFDVLLSVNDKLIYVYDFLNLWSFYVELVEITKQKASEAKIVLSVGEVPKEAPVKEFKADLLEDEYDEYTSDYENFESLDDFDNY